MIPPVDSSARLFAPLRNAVWRMWCVGLVVAALALHGLIPLGYMPEIGKGLLAVRICHAGFAQTIFLDAQGHKADPAKPFGKDKPAAEAPCIFSLSALFTATGTPVFLALLFAFILGAARRPPRTRFTRRPIYANASARAPPVFS